MSLRVLSLDPGAERFGWAVLDVESDEYTYVDSGIVTTPRLFQGKRDPYQPYRLRIIHTATTRLLTILNFYKPEEMWSESVPPAGAKSGGAIQMQLAAVSSTVFHSLAWQQNIRSFQISGTTAKKNFTGDSKASKAKVKDAVLKFFPELEQKRSQWTGKGAVYEEPDAIMLGVTSQGYKVP